MACCWHILALLIFISPDTIVAEHVSTRGLAFGFLLWIVHEPLPIFFLVSCLYFRILFRSYFIPLKNNIWILLENTYSMWIKYINNNNKTNLSTRAIQNQTSGQICLMKLQFADTWSRQSTKWKIKPWFIAFADFYGASIPTMANCKLPTWCH